MENKFIKNRTSIVDLWKFIACFMIMTHHLGYLGIERGFHWDTGSRFVEFFLMVTGYYSYKHFSDRVITDRCKTAIYYTIKKFIPFIPYTTIAIAGQYILETVFCSDWHSRIYNLTDMPFELVLVIQAFKMPHTVPLWYLSSLFLVFPAFVLFLEIQNRYLIFIISFFLVLTGYGTWSVYFPHNMLRVLCGLLFGTALASGTEILNEMDTGITINTKLLAVIENLSLLCAVFITYHNYSADRIIRLLFAVSIGVMLSGKSASYRVQSSVITFLGKISMPIYIVHWTVGTIVLQIADFLSRQWGCSMTRGGVIALYYLGTISISVMLYLLIEGRNKDEKSI